MSENVYKVVELVGSSTVNVEDAIQKAVHRANQTLRNLRWFEVTQIRGCVDGNVITYQVVLKAGFTLDIGGE